MSGDPNCMLCFAVATGEPRGSRETGVDHTCNQEEISKLNQVLHLLEGREKKTTRAKARGKYQRLAEEELRRPKEQGGRRSGQGSRRD
jgi:hypothetical protein